MEQQYENEIIEQVRYTTRYRIEELNALIQDLKELEQFHNALKEQAYQITEFVTSIAKEYFFHARLVYKSEINELWSLVRNYGDKDHVVGFITKLTTELKFKLFDKWDKIIEQIAFAYGINDKDNAVKYAYTDEQYIGIIPEQQSLTDHLRKNDWLVTLCLINLAGDI